MVPLIWTEPARNDLESIFGYFNAISTKVAIHYSEEFIKAGDRLKIFPEMGPLEPPKPLTAMKEKKHSICYMILPEGIREDLDEGLKALSEKHAISIVVIPGVNWNDDLTPWPAEGVFKKAKPFGGQASSFLEKLTREIIPETEKRLGVADAERTLLGVSLSGLFAVWAAFHTDAFTNIISISGSLWYDDFVDWMKVNTPTPQLKKVCMLLGEKEKHAKDKRMATVEERTVAAAQILKSKTNAAVSFELVEGTHFSPILPRLEKALAK